MNTTSDIGIELFREIGYLADDENSLKKMLAYARKLVAKKKEATTEETLLPSRTKAEWMDGFNQACQEAKLYKEGKLALKTWEEVYHEL